MAFAVLMVESNVVVVKCINIHENKMHASLLGGLVGLTFIEGSSTNLACLAF